MTTSDGYVLSVTKVVDHGPSSSRWNLVILGDGYRASEMSKYHSDVQNVIDTLYATAPFNELWCGINVYRVDVASTDSGADDPTACGGTGATARTYFDATFCGDGAAPRLLTVNDGTALSVASSQVPQVHVTLVVVNSSIYGGSGGSVATFSTDPSAVEIAMHEMGHTAFGLADEYPCYLSCGSGETGHDNYTAGEPAEPNVTINTNRATNKWRDLILTTTQMPTTSNANCAQCDTQPSPVPVGTVGTFEGTRYFHCGVYRPEFNCRMRALNNPFCAVCTRVIRQTLTPFLPPEYITLLTPSISFTDIPEGMGGTGVTTFRAIVFEIVTCTTKTLSIVTGPTGGFSTPLGTVEVVAPPKTTPIAMARLWLSYTSTTAGATSSGSLTVKCLETGQTWVININANTVARPKTAVVLVLDRSGSMIEDAGDGVIKVQKLREAAGLFVDAMLPGDYLGIVRFNQTAELLMPVTTVGPLMIGAGRIAALGHITGPELNPNGTTSIGAGVVVAKQALDGAQAVASPHYDHLAMLVLTDGMENTSPFLADVSSSITANTFAIGLGQSENISTAALNALTQGHNGYLLITGVLTPDQSARLNKYFLQIFAGITNANVILDPHGDLNYGVEHRIPFDVVEADMGLDVFLLSPAVQRIDFQLETPDGQRIRPSMSLSTVEFVSREVFSYYRVSLPAILSDVKGSHYGNWHAIVKLPPASVSLTHKDDSLEKAMSHGLLPYDLIIHCYSNLNFRANVQQSSYEPGVNLAIYASLKEYDMPVEKRAQVWVEISLPNGSEAVIDLQEQSPGQFQGSFKTTVSGLYKLRVRAKGETLQGDPFWREQTLTAVAYIGGDLQPANDAQLNFERRLCRLLRCLLEGGAIDLALVKQLQLKGLDLKEVARCVEKYCSEINPTVEGYKPAVRLESSKE